MNIKKQLFFVSLIALLQYLIPTMLSAQECTDEIVHYVEVKKTNPYTEKVEKELKTKIVLCFGDIAKQQVDAIVDPTNEEMLGSGGTIDAAIHLAASAAMPLPKVGTGDDLLTRWSLKNVSVKEYKKPGWIRWMLRKEPVTVRLTVGQVIASPAFALSNNGVKMIIHAVYPRVDQDNWARLLKSTYQEILKVAEQGIYTNNEGQKQKASIKTIAIPLFGLRRNMLGFLKRDAVEIAADAIFGFAYNNIGFFDEIRIVVPAEESNREQIKQLYRKVFNSIMREYKMNDATKSFIGQWLGAFF